MKKQSIILSLSLCLIILAISNGCSPKKAETQPEVEPTDLGKRIPVTKDSSIYKVTNVIREYGRQTKDYTSYREYQKLKQKNKELLVDPTWFYDSHLLEWNQKNHWATIILGTAHRAIRRDPRIGELLKGLPKRSITIRLKTPSGKIYLLNDAEADGVLDFARAAEQKGNKLNIKLLDLMQKKYSWIIRDLKNHYRRKK